MSKHLLKFALIPILGFLLSMQPARADEEADALDRMLKDRIKLNAKYGDEYAKGAKDSPFAKDLVPLEKKIGQGWVDYLKYLRTLKNHTITKQVLKLEYMTELSGSYYDLEIAEGLVEKAAIRGDILKWKKELARLQKFMPEEKATKPPTPSTPTSPPVK